MNKSTLPIDIRNIPDLINIVHEMQKTKASRVLQEDRTLVAMIIPMKTVVDVHETFGLFDFQPLAEIKASLHHADYPETEVKDIVKALSEIPQYADKGIRKSK